MATLHVKYYHVSKNRALLLGVRSYALSLRAILDCFTVQICLQLATLYDTFFYGFMEGSYQWPATKDSFYKKKFIWDLKSIILYHGIKNGD